MLVLGLLYYLCVLLTVSYLISYFQLCVIEFRIICLSVFCFDDARTSIRNCVIYGLLGCVVVRMTWLIHLDIRGHGGITRNCIIRNAFSLFGEYFYFLMAFSYFISYFCMCVIEFRTVRFSSFRYEYVWYAVFKCVSFGLLGCLVVRMFWLLQLDYIHRRLGITQNIQQDTEHRQHRPFKSG